jgi:hypothetical protein
MIAAAVAAMLAASGCKKEDVPSAVPAKDSPAPPRAQPGSKAAPTTAEPAPGSQAQPAAGSQTQPGEKTAMIHCEGVNACAGKGACKTAKNDCSGKNGCKGQGWVEVSAEDCARQGGKALTVN